MLNTNNNGLLEACHMSPAKIPGQKIVPGCPIVSNAAEAGEFKKAIAVSQTAYDVADHFQLTELKDHIMQRMALYQNETPFHKE